MAYPMPTVPKMQTTCLSLPLIQSDYSPHCSVPRKKSNSDPTHVSLTTLPCCRKSNSISSPFVIYIEVMFLSFSSIDTLPTLIICFYSANPFSQFYQSIAFVQYTFSMNLLRFYTISPSFVIRFSMYDAIASINLFQQNNPHELMRKGHFGKTERQIRSPAQRLVQAERTADKKL